MRESVRRMWTAYCNQTGLHPSTPLPPAWHFCDTQADADACARLVLARRKRATAPSLWGFEHRAEAMPLVGALDIVTFWNGEACAIIRTTHVSVVPFSAVSAEFAAAEGEGDGSLAYWRQAHWAYYTRELAGTRRVPSLDMPVVCQYFEVVYPKIAA
jgi:uncharacterized protein YhfF